MLSLYVLHAVSGERIPAEIDPASKEDLAATHDWQTSWESAYARQLPNKVALHRKDNRELLGLMSYSEAAKTFTASAAAQKTEKRDAFQSAIPSARRAGSLGLCEGVLRERKRA